MLATSLTGYEINNIIDQYYVSGPKKRVNIVKLMNLPDANSDENESKNGFRFNGVICRNCLELHLDKCDQCSPKTGVTVTETIQSKSSARTGLITVLLHEKFKYKREKNIENLVENNYIDSSNFSIPFSTSLSKTEFSSDFLQRRKSSKRSDEHARLKLDKHIPSEHFFADLKDLRKKIYFKTEAIKLLNSPVPNCSNDLFDQIEKFDLAKKYKIDECQSKMPNNIRELIRRSHMINAKVKTRELETRFEKIRFKKCLRV